MYRGVSGGNYGRFGGMNRFARQRPQFAAPQPMQLGAPPGPYGGPGGSAYDELMRQKQLQGGAPGAPGGSPPFNPGYPPGPAVPPQGIPPQGIPPAIGLPGQGGPTDARTDIVRGEPTGSPPFNPGVQPYNPVPETVQPPVPAAPVDKYPNQPIEPGQYMTGQHQPGDQNPNWDPANPWPQGPQQPLYGDYSGIQRRGAHRPVMNYRAAFGARPSREDRFSRMRGNVRAKRAEEAAIQAQRPATPAGGAEPVIGGGNYNQAAQENPSFRRAAPNRRRYRSSNRGGTRTRSFY